MKCICCPGGVNICYPSALVQSCDQSVLGALAQTTGVSVKALAKRTLAGSSLRWPQDWWAGGNPPSPQLCPTCLTTDLQSGDHVQFLRLQWQCAAMTICPKHLLPLFEACPHCHRINWPICEATGLWRFRFLCGECGSPQEQDAAPDLPASEAALRLLLAFETQLLRALQGRSIQWSWIGYATPTEFLLLVTDLLWAITRPTDRSTLIIRHLQTRSFPLGHRSFQFRQPTHWGFTSANDRRCLLAAALAAFGSSRVRSLLHASPEHSGGDRLLSCLSTNNIADLQRRSWRWPPAAHNSLRHAAQPYLPRRRGRPFLTI